LSRFLQFVSKEPALFGGFATSVLPALTALGVITLSGEQVAQIVVLINALVAVIVRFKVYAVPNLPGPPGPHGAPAVAEAPAVS
jgi:hypothetical protein